jgi:hypothetical protein
VDSGSTSVIVAFRDDDGTRTRLWDLVRERFERLLPEAEIVVGTDDSVPFNKCRALNEAARKASGEVLILTDADTWVSEDLLRGAVRLVAAGEAGWCKPWNRKLKLDPEATQAVLDLGEAWNGRKRKDWRVEAPMNTWWAGPPVVFRAETFWNVGAMDERLAGWGEDDACLGWALKAFTGRAKVLRGDSLHLSHPRLGRSGSDLWPGQTSRDANLALGAEYRVASRSPELMRELIASRDVPTLAPLG